MNGTVHYNDVILGAIASQITSLTIVYSTVYSDADQRKHQSSASLAFVRGIHREPVNSRHKWPVTRKMFPFDDVIMKWRATLAAITGTIIMMPLFESNRYYLFEVLQMSCRDFKKVSPEMSEITDNSTVCAIASPVLTAKKTLKLRITVPIVLGIQWWPVDSPHKGPVMLMVWTYEVLMISAHGVGIVPSTGWFGTVVKRPQTTVKAGNGVAGTQQVATMGKLVEANIFSTAK